MNKLNIFALSAALVACVSSCELKDELTGDRNTSTEMGMLDLSVAVQGEQSRAEETVPAAGDMWVEVTGTEEGVEPVYNGLYSEMENPMRVPVGTYTVKAHTQGEIQKQMSTPYYGGEAELDIQKDITDEATVTCKVMNTKVQLNFAEGFEGRFSDWTVTLDNGKESVLTFTSETAPIYWYLAEDAVSELIFNFKGTTVPAEGEEPQEISWQKSFSKNDADNVDNDNSNFTGGEFLNITLDVNDEGTDEDPRPQISFGIDVDLTWNTEDGEQTVQIPVEDVTVPVEPGGDEDPEQPEDSAITIGDNGTGYLTNGVTVTGGEYPTDVAVVMNVKNGIKNLYVKLTTDNPNFEAAAGLMGLTSGDGLDLTSKDASALKGMFALPEVGSTEYNFTMNDTLFGLLCGTEEVGGFPGKHDFTLTVIDADGNQESSTLTVNIIE